jgi:organic radical activating enzyme
MKPYTVKEIFYSLQGEGARKGTANVFIRFAGCNMACNVKEHGFDCDTDFTGGEKMSAEEIAAEALKLWTGIETSKRWCILTGGEPTLQVDDELVRALCNARFYIAIETNGTRSVPAGVNYVAVSPKGPPEKIVVREANEVRVVVHPNRGIERYDIIADQFFVSPAFDPVSCWPLKGALETAIELVKAQPNFVLSMQDHKMWGVR